MRRALEHAWTILDPTRVSPYRPAARKTPAISEAGHTTAPDRAHQTIRHRDQPGARPTAAVNPLRGSSASLRPLRGDRRGRPCRKLLAPSRKAGRPSTEPRAWAGEPLRRRRRPVQRNPRPPSVERGNAKGLAIAEASTHASRSNDGTGDGQRDAVGRTSSLRRALEHAWTILDPTRVSPYRPAARKTPAISEAGHTTAPDRAHQTIRHRDQPGARPTAAVNPLRGSSASLRPLRGDRRGRPCRKLPAPSRKAGRPSTETRASTGEPLRRRRSPVQRNSRPPSVERRNAERSCNRGGVHTRQDGAASHPAVDAAGSGVGAAAQHAGPVAGADPAVAARGDT